MMDFDAWTVDVDSGSAVHATGFKLVVEGDPANPMGVNPGRFPEQLSAVQQATLLRCGIEALIKAAQKRRNQNPRPQLNVVKQAAERKTAPRRPVLSLKR